MVGGVNQNSSYGKSQLKLFDQKYLQHLFTTSNKSSKIASQLNTILTQVKLYYHFQYKRSQHIAAKYLANNQKTITKERRRKTGKTVDKVKIYVNISFFVDEPTKIVSFRYCCLGFLHHIA